MSPAAELLRRPLREAVLGICQDQLGRAMAAAGRLQDPADVEALHDFRVALRRLRSTLRTWRRELADDVGPDHLQSLREIQTATGGGRDAEVAIEWLLSERPRVSPEGRPGLDWLVGVLKERLSREMAGTRSEMRAAWAVEGELLRAALADAQGRQGTGEPFARPLARALERRARKLSRLLGPAASAHDREGLHRARIALKRLRYLVEPVAAEGSAAAELVRAARGLQDLLGLVNDTHVQLQELADRTDSLAGTDEAARLAPGLEELRGLACTRLAGLERTLKTDWTADDGQRLRRSVQALLDELAEA